MTKQITGIFAAFLLLAVLFPSCGAETPVPAEWDGRTLCGVAYITKNGMTWGDDFEIRLTEGEITYVRSFSRFLRQYMEKEHRSLSGRKWNKIGEAVLSAMPELKEIPPSPESEERQEVFAADQPVGPTGLWLTWRASDGTEETVRYAPSGGERTDALLELLRETGH